MRNAAAGFLLLTLAISPAAIAVPSWDLEGVYVEARSAQVFIGGCIWNSEAMTIGREAVMAWRIDKGHIGGVEVAGLAVVAAIAGDENLAINPEAARRTVLYVDAAATTEQRQALTDLYVTENALMFGEVIDVVAAPIDFDDTAEGYRVSAGSEVVLEAKALHVDHKQLNQCGEAQWYEPFVELQDSTLGTAIEHSYRGQALSARWSDPNKQSAFFGRFEF
jgi:hypothetical protein